MASLDMFFSGPIFVRLLHTKVMLELSSAIDSGSNHESAARAIIESRFLDKNIKNFS